MPYWVKRIVLKDGEIVTERELEQNENLFEDDPALVVGDLLAVSCRGRTFEAKVVWGNWPGQDSHREPGTIVPLRVEET
jgi:hypothetical protein